MRARRYCVGFEVVSLVDFCLVGNQMVGGFLTRTLRAATMVRGSGDILVDVVASFAGVAYGGECLLGVAVWCYRCRIV